MSARLRSIGMRILVGACFLAEAIYVKGLHSSMQNFTTVNYEGLGRLKFPLFDIQGGLEIAYRGLLVLGLIWLLLAVGVVFNFPKHDSKA